MLNQLLAINTLNDIPKIYRKTPIALLLEYHNLNRKFEKYENAKILIGMCMDSRKYLKIPDNFAFIIRAGGANLRYSEFKLSFAVAIGNVHHMVLIGHSQCGMVNLVSRRKEFVSGLIKNAGWTKDRAEEHFMNYAPMFEIENAVDFIRSEVSRLRLRYPKIQIAPLYYPVEDNRLYLIRE